MAAKSALGLNYEEKFDENGGPQKVTSTSKAA
jgi:hypothetical protein